MRRRTQLACLALWTCAAGCATTGGPGASLGALDDEPPAPRVVLHDGGAWTGWSRRDGTPSEWLARDDGSVLVRGGDAVSDRTFGDFRLHLEFRLPAMPGKTGQARANSGVYLHGRYEIQVLDTMGQAPFPGGCGGIYGIAAPRVNAAAPPETWQSYDVIFRAPRLDADGAVVEPARVTVLHNDVVIHNNLELPRTTPGGLDERMVARGPILLQDHGDPVRYRNIWVEPLD